MIMEHTKKLLISVKPVKLTAVSDIKQVKWSSLGRTWRDYQYHELLLLSFISGFLCFPVFHLTPVLTLPYLRIPVVELNQLISSWIFQFSFFFFITSHPAVANADAVPSCLIPRQILISVIYFTPVCLVKPSTRSWRVTAANVPARLPLCAELTIMSLLWHSRILKSCAWR